MNDWQIGVIHPGDMGISIAASLQQGANQVFWASEGRSPSTRARAEQFGLHDATTLASLCRICDAIVCVCPPDAAEKVADAVVACGYTGVYLDANAIAPERTMRIGRKMNDAGITFIDGGIIGGPGWKAGETWLYLSGSQAQIAASWFEDGVLETSIVGETIGTASALKLCYAAYTKGTTALLSAILAAAETHGVRTALWEHWAREDASFPEQVVGRVTRSATKAWRFRGEMEEIAALFGEAGLPSGFHQAAAEVYDRLTLFKDAKPAPELESIVAELLGNPTATT